MAFNPQATYYGGQLLGQGLSSIGQGIGGAIQQYQDISDKATQSDALMQYLSQQTDPVTGKPIIDPKTLQAYQQHSQRQRAFVAGGMHAGMTLADSLQKLGYANQETQARTKLYQAQATKTAEPGIPTQVGDKTINLPPTSAASAEQEKQRIALEQQRVDIAKQPKGLTQQQVFQQQAEKDKAFQAKIQASPEYDFTKKYAVQPQQVLTPDVLDPTKQAYRLFQTDAKGNPTEIQPEYDQYGIPRRPSYLPSDTPTYWSPASDVYRGNKIERNVNGVKTEQFAPDPTGEHVDIGGQKIPFSAIQGINTRHDLLLKQATAALGQGADWQALAKQWAALGYNVQELPEPPKS
jgi:hypothetical protein